MSSTPRDIDQLSERKELPEGWRWVRLGDVCNRHTGIRDQRIEPDTIFQYVDISSVCNSKKCITVAKSILGKDAPSRARQIIRFNDIIVATTRPNLNAVAQVPKELDNQICSTGFCVLRAGESILPEYLFAFVCYELFVDALSDLVKGALYPAVNDGQVLAQHIPLPPLPEQSRIAAILKEQMGAVEKARTTAQERLKAIKALPAAFLRQIFPDSGQPLPDGWRWAKLGEIFDITSSKRVFESDWTRQGVPFYRAREIVKLSQQGFVENDLFISEEMFAEYSAKYGIPQTGDIMVTGVGTLGICHVVREVDKFYFKDGNIIWLKKKSENESSFIEYAFRSDLLRKQIDDSSGATVGTFTIIKAKNTRVPLPPMYEQQRIVALISEQMAVVEKARTAAEEELKAINTLPAALLRRAFNGEI
jgi:type I restriction enzyme, S subunit